MKSRHQTDQTTFVVGHQRPDTDSAVSAVVYAALLNAQSHGGALEGVVLGEPSAQTRWLFDGTGIPLPRQIVISMRPSAIWRSRTFMPLARSPCLAKRSN